ncbi:MAG: nucleotidyltransferase family protein [Gammaproteobacteria bacterium]|nr:nucleotidyltransferase family protein [Gammaproteobacteria bacterium]
MPEPTLSPYVQQLPAEEGLLLACARSDMTQAEITRAQTLASDLDWHEVERLAREHGVGTLVYPNLKQHFGHEVPAEILDRLRQLSIATTQSNLGLLRELLSTVRELNSHGIECAVFKGLLVNQLAYRNLAIRKSGDVDLLVRKQDYSRAKALFLSQGFTQTLSDKVELLCLQSGLWHEERKLQIDLHWGIPPRELNIRADKIMERITHVAVGGVNVPSFAMEDVFIILCTNATKEFWNQLLYPYRDIAELLRSGIPLDWRSLFNRARDLGCRRAVTVALAVVETLYGVPLPEQVKRELRREPDCEKVERELLRQLFEQDIDDSLVINKTGHHLYYFVSSARYHEALIDGALDRLRFRYLVFVDPNDETRIRRELTPIAALFHYSVKPFWMCGKYLLKILRRSGDE